MKKKPARSRVGLLYDASPYGFTGSRTRELLLAVEEILGLISFYKLL